MPRAKLKICRTITAVLLLSGLAGPAMAEDFIGPQTVVIAPGFFDYRASGEYLRDNYPVDAPVLKLSISKPLEIMKYQVSVGDYETCVGENVCEIRLGQGKHDPRLPVTGTSYLDAMTFAKWLSDKTGSRWRLPTDEEWAYAAGSRFFDDAVKIATDEENPSTRWLARYRKYADLALESDPVLKPAGSYGANENGVYDLSGNIWEWTDSCYQRVRMDSKGKVIGSTENCGVKVSAGLHRAYISSFIQDAKGGGCSVGAPPQYLGMRLVREPEPKGIYRILEKLGL